MIHAVEKIWNNKLKKVEYKNVKNNPNLRSLVNFKNKKVNEKVDLKKLICYKAKDEGKP